MTKPTKTQLAILSQAAASASGCVCPVSDTIKAKGAALNRSLTAMLKRGWIAERIAGAEDAVWRADENGQQKTLVLSAAGYAAIGVEPPATDSAEAKATAAPRRPNGKLGAVLSAIEVRGGATLGELVAQTGWLPHSTRAALTQLRKRGYAIALSDRDGRRAYHLDQPIA